eukprot:566790_1
MPFRKPNDFRRVASRTRFRNGKICEAFAPPTIVKHPRPMHISLPQDSFIKKNKQRGDYIPEMVKPTRLDFTSSPDFRLASMQREFRKLSYSEEEAYYLAKLRMRGQLTKKLRNLYL